MNTWENMFRDVFNRTGDTFETITTTLTTSELVREFDDGYGGSEGEEFTAWSDNWVYFPVVYDGAEWIGYAPRNPCETKTEHQGGE